MKVKNIITLVVVALVVGGVIILSNFYLDDSVNTLQNTGELQQAPDFELQTLDGQTVSLKDFRGKPVVLNFWASW